MSTLQAGITLRPDFSRIINASGSSNISSISVTGRGTKYVSDLCTTLIDIQWRWNLLLFFGSFAITWVIFAGFYILLAYVNGDQFEQADDWLPCVENVHDFASALLFSIETMSTIGYGSRYVTEACPGAYFGVIVQSVLGAAMQFALAGLVVAKVKRAKKRCTTILFSKIACIYAEDLKLRLAIRIGDMRKSDIVGAHTRAYFIQTSLSKTGDKIPVQYSNMDFKSEGGNDKLFLPWPSYIIHDIDEKSPLYNLSRDDTISENYEMIVMLEAVSSSLSQAFQVRKSYHPWEIRWGHRFLSLGHTYEDMFDENIVDYENFHETKAVTTPLVSAQEIHEMSVRGDISPEKLQTRRDSRQEPSLFMRRKSVTDTFLGAESDLSVDAISMSDTVSMDRLRRISAITYHGPGTMERRKTLAGIFVPPAAGISFKDRRHSTGQFLEPPPFLRGRRRSYEWSLSGSISSKRSSRERIYEPKVKDIRSETFEESGPRYIRTKKRVTVNPNPTTPTRKCSDPGLPSAPLVSALTKRRRHSTWQFSEQNAFINDYKRLHPELYLGPSLEVVESEDSDQQDSSHGGDVQEAASLDVDNNANLLEQPDKNLYMSGKSQEETHQPTGRRRVIRGSLKTYIVQRVPDIVIENYDESSREEDTGSDVDGSDGNVDGDDGVVDDNDNDVGRNDDDVDHDKHDVDGNDNDVGGNDDDVDRNEYTVDGSDDDVGGNDDDVDRNEYTVDGNDDDVGGNDDDVDRNEYTVDGNDGDGNDGDVEADVVEASNNETEVEAATKERKSSEGSQVHAVTKERKSSESSQVHAEPSETNPEVDDSEGDNPAFIYDPEDDIGYSRHIVDSDDEDASHHSKVNYAYESDNNDNGN